MNKSENFFKKEWQIKCISKIIATYNDEKDSILEMSEKDIYDTMQSYSDHNNQQLIKENERLKAMLRVANCLNVENCNNTGILINEHPYTGEVIPEPCEWCFTRDEICGTDFTKPRKEKESSDLDDFPF